MTTLVTGGTGFLGKRVVSALVERGHKVKMLVRENSNLKGLENLDIDFITGDVRDRDSIRNAAQGCSHLYHLAALVRAWIPKKKLFHDINVVGTKNVFEIAKEVGIQKMVYTSTVHLPGFQKNTIFLLWFLR